MSFNFTPLSEEELNKRDDLLEKGTYDFEVVRSDKRDSKSGNPMAILHLNVWDEAGRSFIVFDYLVFSQTKLCLRKIRHFCSAVGILEDYEKGTLVDDFSNLSGKVQIGVQEPMPKSDGTYYPEKNVVIDYITMDNAQSKKDDKKQEDSFNDDLPF